MTDILTKLRSLEAEVTICGSKVTCDPPPEGTDTDFLVYCQTEDVLSDVVTMLVEAIWDDITDG